MLKDLHIKNLVLMQSCCLELDKGLTILTGETGSGKTAILQGLKLLLGQKLDTSLIRHGEKKGSIQARFEITSPFLLQALLELNIEIEDSTLILYREISIEGKSKNFINDRMVSLSLLQKVGSHLVQIVDQSSHHELKTIEKQRDLLDLFGSLEKQVADFSSLYEKSKKYKIDQEKLLEKQQQKQREWDFCLEQQKELESIKIEEGEEERLFQEYTLFSKSQEILTKTEQICDLLKDGPQNAFTPLTRAKNLCHSLCSYHTMFQEPLSFLEQSLLALNEASHLVTKSFSSFDLDPKQLESLENKLSNIHKIKKKYGSSSEDWKLYKKALDEKIESFENLENDQKNLNILILQTEKDLSSQGKALTEQRKKAAYSLSSSLQKELFSLNMASSKVFISVEHHSRSHSGEDLISFQLQANSGEAFTPIKDHASGGELSRLLLGIKLCLAEKNNIPTLVFDEIDANVGGQTAKMIGEKLLALSSHCQILCITHFPQVAEFASHHYLVQKNETLGRTFSTVSLLDKKSKEVEILRMLGGKNLKKPSTQSP